MSLDDVDYLVEIISYVTCAPCHDLHKHCTQASRTPLMRTHALYRLVGERGRTRGAGGDPGAETSRMTRVGRRATGVPGPQA